MEGETSITTLKISKKTKKRLDRLKEYKRETYEEIIEKMLELLNICKVHPTKAQATLIGIDNRHKENIQRLDNTKEF